MSRLWVVRPVFKTSEEEWPHLLGNSSTVVIYSQVRSNWSLGVRCGYEDHPWSSWPLSCHLLVNERSGR